jgi:hypothetical protein
MRLTRGDISERRFKWEEILMRGDNERRLMRGD